MIVVEGVAGIGKSSLLAAAIGSAEAQGVTVLRARAGPLEQDAAWGVARQLFAPLQRGPQWSELTVGAAGLARRVLDAEAPEPALAGDAMHAAAHGLEWLAVNLAERAPAVLVVDDVHWADAPSLRWLAQLAVRGRFDHHGADRERVHLRHCRIGTCHRLVLQRSLAGDRGRGHRGGE